MKDKEEKDDQVLHWYLDQAQNIQNFVGERASALHIAVGGNGEKEAR